MTTTCWHRGPHCPDYPGSPPLCLLGLSLPGRARHPPHTGAPLALHLRLLYSAYPEPMGFPQPFCHPPHRGAPVLTPHARSLPPWTYALPTLALLPQQEIHSGNGETGCVKAPQRGCSLVPLFACYFAAGIWPPTFGALLALLRPQKHLLLCRDAGEHRLGEILPSASRSPSYTLLFGVFLLS